MRSQTQLLGYGTCQLGGAKKEEPEGSFFVSENIKGGDRIPPSRWRSSILLLP